jgi:hypothetical protein
MQPCNERAAKQTARLRPSGARKRAHRHAPQLCRTLPLARGISPAMLWQMQRRSAGARCALRQRVRHCRVPSRCTCWSGRVASCYLAAASRSTRACAACSRGAAPPNFAFTAITGAPPGRVACELSGLRCLFAPSLTHCVFLCAEDARCVAMAWSAPRRAHDARCCAAGRREVLTQPVRARSSAALLPLPLPAAPAGRASLQTLRARSVWRRCIAAGRCSPPRALGSLSARACSWRRGSRARKAANSALAARLCALCARCRRLTRVALALPARA